MYQLMEPLYVTARQMASQKPRAAPIAAQSAPYQVRLKPERQHQPFDVIDVDGAPTAFDRFDMGVAPKVGLIGQRRLEATRLAFAPEGGGEQFARANLRRTFVFMGG